IILWADVQMTADKILVIFEPRTIQTASSSQTLVPFLTYDELQKNLGDSSLLRLKDMLLKFKDHRVIINVRDYRPGMDVVLAELIDEPGVIDRVLIQSELDGILRDMRSQRATGLFGSSQAQITQL